MDKKTLLMLAPLVLGLIGIGALFAFSEPEDQEPIVSSSEVQNNDSFVSLEEFQAEPAKFEGKRTVYFFHAEWCPTCKTLENDIKRNLGSIPSNVVIVKTNYDTQQDLRQEYGVVTQHTLVQVNSQGDVLGKWIAQPSLRDVLSNLQSV